MDKRILKEITKRWIKGIIYSNEAIVAFGDSGLTEDEINYIQKCSNEISNRITTKSINFNVDDLVNEYYEYE